ncbi:hypothetical protein QFC21_006799 [Naganishia friedmannii]|uniref:Uncharacterized protein n=1 Tax=Naganishia friedmannii TaxID=89922 RepID=A0ACC2V0F4_9TREE|nr:hypothetical protein QFC21_006799 [Naganishia friedmannii]
MRTEYGDNLTLGVSTAAGKTAAVIHQRPSSSAESEAETVPDEQESGVDQGHQLLCQHIVSSQIVAAWRRADKQMRRRPVLDIDSGTEKDLEYDAEDESSDDDFAKVSKKVETAVQVLRQLRHQKWKSDGRRKSQRRRFDGGGMKGQSGSCSNASDRDVEHSIGPVAQPSFVQSGNNKRRKIH